MSALQYPAAYRSVGVRAMANSRSFAHLLINRQTGVSRGEDCPPPPGARGAPSFKLFSFRALAVCKCEQSGHFAGLIVKLRLTAVMLEGFPWKQYRYDIYGGGRARYDPSHTKTQAQPGSCMKASPFPPFCRCCAAPSLSCNRSAAAREWTQRLARASA